MSLECLSREEKTNDDVSRPRGSWVLSLPLKCSHLNGRHEKWK
jgi:hypothetical protein